VGGELARDGIDGQHRLTVVEDETKLIVYADGNVRDHPVVEF